MKLEQKTEKIHEIRYVKRDFLYNNGLINAFLLLQKRPLGEEIESTNDKCIIRWKGIEIALSQNSLSFACDYENLFEIYKFLMEKYFSSILEETDHLRSYVSKDLKEVLIKPRINTKLFASRVKIKNLQKEYSVEKIPYTVYKNLKEDVKKKEGEYKNFDKKFWYGDEKKINEEKDVEVVVFRGIDEIGKALSNNIVSLQRSNKDCMICGSPFTELLMKNDRKKDICLESQNLVFDFGYSPPINRDHRTNKKIPLCFMCDMFYRLSVIDNYFYNNSIFIFDLFSLIRLKEIKEELEITIDYKPRENKIRTNVSSKDLPISGPYSSLLNVLYHIYQKSKEKRGELFSELKGSQIIRFDMRSDSIDNCIFYNRLSYIFDLFEKIDRENLNNFFRTLIVYCYYKGQKKGSGIPREEICKNILFQFHIEPILSDVSYFYFSQKEPKNQRTLSTAYLCSFLGIYNEKIRRGIENMKYEELLKICSTLGERIGYFAADNEEKNLVYHIREIGNLERLVEYFRDFEYAVLKEDKGEILNKIDENTGKKYGEIIGDILKVANEKTNISLIRDLLGIFAVQKYLSTKYAKSKSGGE